MLRKSERFTGFEWKRSVSFRFRFFPTCSNKWEEITRAPFWLVSAIKLSISFVILLFSIRVDCDWFAWFTLTKDRRAANSFTGTNIFSRFITFVCSRIARKKTHSGDELVSKSSQDKNFKNNCHQCTESFFFQFPNKMYKCPSNIAFRNISTIKIFRLHEGIF